MTLNPLLFESTVRAALVEDFGRGGDITTQATIPPDRRATALLTAREAGVIAGLDVARCAFELVDPGVRFESRVSDGTAAEPGAAIAQISGTAASLLTAERTALSRLRARPRCQIGRAHA